MRHAFDLSNKRAGSVRESGLRHARHQLECVLIVKLLQYLIWKVDAVQLPEGMVVAVIVEVLVSRLEHAPVIRILVGLEAVFAEENPILILDEELTREPRLAADVVKD